MSQIGKKTNNSPTVVDGSPILTGNDSSQMDRHIRLTGDETAIVMRQNGTIEVSIPSDTAQRLMRAEQNWSVADRTLSSQVARLTAITVALHNEQIMAVLLNLSKEIGAI